MSIMIPGGDLLPPLDRATLDWFGLPEHPAIVGLFEGYGGLTLGVQHVVGGELVGYSEIEPSSIKLLEEHFPGVPNLGDVSHIGWPGYTHAFGRVDVMVGGFPCQDVSPAGLGAGLRQGTRSGLWYEFARAIAETRPKLVVIENVPGLRSARAGASAEEVDTDEHEEANPDEDVYAFDGGDMESGADDLGFADWQHRPVLRALGAVLGDLASLGYHAEWDSVRASNVGAAHKRERIFIIAWPDGDPSDSGRV